MIRGTANESDDRPRINNVAMLDGPIDREEDIENTDRDENKDLEQENEELKASQFYYSHKNRIAHFDENY